MDCKETSVKITDRDAAVIVGTLTDLFGGSPFYCILSMLSVLTIAT